MIAANPNLDALSETDRQLLESWLVSFDQSWSENRLADQVRALPPASSPLRLLALIEMVKIDLERQWQHGKRPTVESYLAAYPELGGADDAPPDLLVAEYEAHRQCGAASLDDFVQRFPRQAQAMRRLAAEITESSGGSTVAEADLATVKPAPTTVRAPQAGVLPGNLPETFGRYRILKILGKGGMGSVYLAHDSQLDRDVALKVPFFEANDDADILRRFHREAQAAAALHHPNICAVHDVGEIDGVHFLAMAYVRGQSLADALKAQQPFPEDQAVAIVRKVALALAQAHRHGVIHRDLKPGNIMLDQTGEPVIMDFGLARRLDHEDARLTKSGAILGTPAYMSPEQVACENETIGRPSDVYSLGVILYELLAGRIPFQGSLTSILAKIVNDSPAAPSTHRPGIDPRLDAICLKAMAKNPAARYTSMEEFAAALADYTRARSQPAARVEQAAPPLRRWPAVVGFTAAALLLGTILYVSTNHGTVKIEIDDKNAVVHVDGNLITIEQLGEPIRFRVGEHELEVTRGGLKVKTLTFSVQRGKNDEPVRVTLLPAPNAVAIAAKAGDPKVPPSGETKPTEKQPALDVRARQPKAFKGHNATVTSVAFSPDSKRVLSAAEDKTVRHWDVATGQELPESRFATKEGTAEKFVLAPDGNRFLYQSMSAAILGDSASAKRLKQVNVATHQSPHKAFARDGRRVIVGAMGTFGDAFAWVWDLESDEKFRFEKHVKSANLRAVALAADGKLALSVGADGIRLWEVDSQKERWQLNRPGTTALAFSPDGKFVASGATLGTVLLHEADTGKEVGHFEGHASAITCIVFSADSRRLLTGSADKTARLWDVANRKELARDEVHTDAVQCVALSPDGLLAATGSEDQTVRVWSLESKTAPVANGDSKLKAAVLELKPGKPVVCQGHIDTVTSVAFSADGQRLLSAAKDKTIRQWEAATGKELSDVRVKIDDGYAEDIVLAHDGRHYLHRRVYAVVLGDVDTKKNLKRVETDPSPSNAMGFARNGRRVIVGVGEKYAGRPFVWVLDLETDKQFSFRNHPKLENLWVVALSADGKLGVSLGRDGVRLWEVDTGKERWNLERPSVTALAFSPDGKFVVSGAMLGTLLLHEADTGKEVGRFEGHTNAITSIVFSADGRRLLTGSADKTARLWDVAKFKELARDKGHTDAVQCVALSPDGLLAATGSKDQTVRLWYTPASE